MTLSMIQPGARTAFRRQSYRDQLLCFVVLAALLPGAAAAQAEAPVVPPIGPDLTQPNSPLKAPPGASGTERRTSGGVLTIAAGTGQLVQLPGPATSVVAADPRVARIQPLSPTSLFVVGIAAGRTTLLATNDAGAPVAQFEVNVRGGPETAAPVDNKKTAAQVQASLRQALRSAATVTVLGSPAGLVLSGKVHNAAEADQVLSVMRSLTGDAQPVVNNLAVEGAIQVNVRVRIAEVNRSISRELGISWSAIGTIAGASFGLTTASAVGALAQGGGALNVRGVGRGFDINPIVDALAQDQLISLLAEPNLTALSGETASFLVGGEYPIPVAAGGNSNAISVSFKQFGISLAFTPTVLSEDRVNMKIRPEVSQLSQAGAVNLPSGNGGTISVPALTVRRAETTVELASGQSFAIAGLLQKTTSQNNVGTNWLSDVPVLGALFRSDSFQRGESELVIIVTPYLVRPPTEQSLVRAPTDNFRAATDLDRILYQRQLARGGTARAQAPLNAGFILE